MAEPDSDGDSFFADILKPGSSLDPRFILILDIAFVALFFILLSLAVLTAGNLHIFALIVIELGLWASVKWYRPVPPFQYTADDTAGSSMS
ncbi:hypothetical protein C8F04DRAFT_936765 [Mycena alexandri]|uniref:Uncharacterized protein n=1 Tax=Mycena alexandri TaxID=1745969 RepID=A0AAD6TKD4_9AGAR|nr:hypothetical protein C8F04DRAFT_936765 [Mycena alexandri]